MAFVRPPQLSGFVFLKPFFRGVRGREYLDVFGLANLIAGVDMGKRSGVDRS